MILTINGKQQEVDDSKTVLDALNKLGIDPKTVVVEHNGNVVRPEMLQGAELRQGDLLEVVRFVGGG